MTVILRSFALLSLVLISTASDLPAALGAIYPRPIDPGFETETRLDQHPRIATDGQGNWVAVWDGPNPETLDPTPLENDILFARSTDGGLTWTAPALLNSNGDEGPLDGNETRPIIAADSQGNFVVVWSGRLYDHDTMPQYGEDLEILFARSIDGGATWSDVAVLNSNAMVDADDDGGRTIRCVGDGHFLAAWTSDFDVASAFRGERDIYFSHSIDGGATWSDLALVNNTGGSDLTDEVLPRLAWDGGANWIAVWATREPPDGAYGIGSAFTGDGGLSWSDPVTVVSNDDTGDHSVSQLTLAATASDSWVAAWLVESGGEHDIFFSRSTSLGQQWSPMQPLNTDAASDERNDTVPILVTDDGGRMIAAWTGDGGPLGTDDDLMFAVSEDGGATWGDPQPLNGEALVDSREDERVALARDGERWVAVWQARANFFTDWEIMVGVFLENVPSGLVVTGEPVSPSAGSPGGSD